jgi:predicted ATPase
MPHLLEVGLKRELTAAERRRFPFAVPAIRELPVLDVEAPVTLFVGENGSGKSTLLEAMAASAELRSFGASDPTLDDSLAKQRELANVLRLAWRPRSRRGFFMRAEDFFGFLRMQARIDARISREKAEFLGKRFDHESPSAGGRHIDEVAAVAHLSRYDSRSHGESFLDLFRSRLEARGLYLLDEPETPLSPKRQLELLKLLLHAAENGSQFVIATHSPVLLGFPGARIYSFDRVPIRETDYDSLDHVIVMRRFLSDPASEIERLRNRDEAQTPRSS